jgi:glycosyltransferase involved in cell wall biosynthesis
MSGWEQENVSAVKIAYIMSRFPKLTETFILYEILALENLGIQVAIYPLLRERQPAIHPGAQRLVEQAHFLPFLSLPILRAQWHFLQRRTVDYFRLWWEVMRGNWGSLRLSVGALAIFPKAVYFAYKMSRQGITHIHAHFATHPAVAALIVHRLTGIPFSFTVHGSDLHVDRRMLKEKVEAAAFARTISVYNKEVMVKECGEGLRGRIHVIHCGIDPTVFARGRKKKPAERFQILCLASFEEVKGHRHLIEACRLLRERGVDFACHLVGDGPLRGAIEAQIAEAGLQEHTHVHGGRPRPAVVRMLAEADVAALASVPTKEGKREGIPVSLMEAMASSLPVVASDLSGIPELVESGCTGLLVPPENAAALADALQLLEQNKEMGSRMGEAGRERVVRAFNLQTNTQALLQRILAGETQAGRTEDPPVSVSASGASRGAGGRPVGSSQG